MTFLPPTISRIVLLAVFFFSASVFDASAAPEKTKVKPSSITPAKQAGERSGKTNSAVAPSRSQKNENVSRPGKRDLKIAGSSAQQPSKRQKEALRRAEQLRRENLARAAADARQRSEESLRDSVQAMIAKDDLSGEDLEIRRTAQSALGNHAGTVVVMDPQTGRVYSIVNQEWAVREGFKPCSTIKLVTGLAGLNEDVINSNDTVNISDSNSTSLTNALAYSKNGYFQQVGGQVGFEKMVAYARKLGLGEKTGINMRNEVAGQLPDSNDRSSIARMSSHGDNFEVTPLQLATLVSAIGNGGKLVVPYVVRSRQDELKFKPRVRRQIPIDSDALRQMLPGMVGSVNYGSGRKAYDPSQTVAGKTGTCIERDGWVGLFTSYAPLANPRLAVVVITRGADARGHVPAAVAGRIYRELSGRFGGSANPQLASKRTSFGPNSSSTPSQVVYISEEDRNELANRTQLGRVSPTNPLVKRVIMPIPTLTQKRSEKESVNSEAGPLNPDGQTRPRRVSMR